MKKLKTIINAITLIIFILLFSLFYFIFGEQSFKDIKGAWKMLGNRDPKTSFFQLIDINKYRYNIKKYDKKISSEYILKYIDNENLQVRFRYLPDILDDGTTISSHYCNFIYAKNNLQKVYRGRSFRKSDFLWKSGDIVSVIVGHNLKNKYKLGEIYDITTVGQMYKMKIVGVLEKDMSVPTVADELELSLNDAFIIPISHYLIGFFNYPEFDLTFQNAVISNNDKVLKRSMEKDSNKEGIPTLRTESSEKIINYWWDSKGGKELFLWSLFFIVGIFSLFINFIWNVYNVLNNRRKNNRISTKELWATILVLGLMVIGVLRIIDSEAISFIRNLIPNISNEFITFIHLANGISIIILVVRIIAQISRCYKKIKRNKKNKIIDTI